MTLTFEVIGTPAPQGSKRGVVHRHTRRVVMIESSAKVTPWRNAVQAAAIRAARAWFPQPEMPLTGPVFLDVTFWLPRPKHHYGTGRNAQVLRASAPEYPAVKPDVDKLVRATLDGLGDGGYFWRDDALVCDAFGRKRYAAAGRPTGATISVATAPITTRH